MADSTVNILDLYKKVKKHNDKVDKSNNDTKDTRISLAEVLSNDIVKNTEKYKDEE